MRADTDQGPRSMLWPDRDDDALKQPEQQLLDAIASGALDHAPCCRSVEAGVC
jgi:hypothetical protein